MPSAISAQGVWVARQRRFAIAGPSGSGKSTVARLLVAANPNSACVQEPEPPPAVVDADSLAPETAEHFQTTISRTRQRQALAYGDVDVLFFDRTFEEDRDVFLPLYETLGYLGTAQVALLYMRSLEAEAAAGPPEGGILLTGRRDVLKCRVLADTQQRPRWLLHHLDLEYNLYSAWMARGGSRFIVQDTSDIDIATVVRIAQHGVDAMLVRGRQIP